jgi:hypothetical protein
MKDFGGRRFHASSFASSEDDYNVGVLHAPPLVELSRVVLVLLVDLVL